jgi:hypothetical protein
VVAGAGVVEDVDVGAGEAFEDRDCCGARDAAGRGLAHAPLLYMLLGVFAVDALDVPHTVVRWPLFCYDLTVVTLRFDEDGVFGMDVRRAIWCCVRGKQK